MQIISTGKRQCTSNSVAAEANDRLKQREKIGLKGGKNYSAQ